VFTGPVLSLDDPLYRSVMIPRSFWKVVAWRANGLKAAGFLLSQEDYISSLEFNPYHVPVRDLPVDRRAAWRAHRRGFWRPAGSGRTRR
jgi:DNA/RNA endonuclease G (NUC1)